MALESFHTTPPDASFTGTGSAAWVAAHSLRMEGGGFLVGRETVGTGAPENIAIGSNLTLSGGTLSAAGGTGAAGVSLVEGVTPILVTGTATTTVALATSGVTAGTYGAPTVIPRFEVSAQGLLVSASPAGTLGTMASFTGYAAAGDVLGTSTTGTLTTALSTTGVTAGTYGNGTAVSQVVVDAKGRVTSASSVNISFPAAGGTSTFALAGDVLGTGLVPGTLTSALSTTGVAAGTYGGPGTFAQLVVDAKGRVAAGTRFDLGAATPILNTGGTLSHGTSGVAAGTYGNGTNVVQLVVNSFGHITNATNVNIAGAGTLAVIQGTTTVASVNQLKFTSGATVTSTAGGVADVAVSGGSSGPTFPGGIPLTGMKYVLVQGSNLSTGDNDLYTVPSGKRALVITYSANNLAGGSGTITAFPEIKVGATYYRLRGNANIGLGVATTQQVGYIAEEGEVLAVNTATNNGLNFFYRVILFDNTCKVYSSKVLGLSNGDNTIYTVPTGLSAILIGSALEFSGVSTLNMVNASGASRDIYWHIVPNGQSVGTGYQFTPVTTVGNNTISQLNGPATLGAGDFVNVNTNSGTATQIAWVNVMEIAV